MLFMTSIQKNISAIGLIFLVGCATNQDRLKDIGAKCRSEGYFCSTSYSIEKNASSDSKTEKSIVEIFFASQKPGQKCHKILSTYELENPEVVIFPKSESDKVNGWECAVIKPRVPGKSHPSESRVSKLMECMTIKDNSESKKCLEAEAEAHK